MVEVDVEQRGGRGAEPVLEIGLAMLDAVIHLSCMYPAALLVDRQSDAEIGAHGGVHRYQPDLQRVVQVGVEADGAVEHRGAVFVLG